MSDVLSRLRCDLEAARGRLSSAQSEIDDLVTAISAIERSSRTSPQAQRRAAKGAKRVKGDLSRLLLDCLRRGHTTVHALRRAVADLGRETDNQNVSNALQRLKRRGLVRKMHGTNTWAVVVEQPLDEPGESTWSAVSDPLPKNENGSAPGSELSH